LTRLGIKFPDTDSLPIEEVLECAKIADEAGFESLWMSDYKSGDLFSVLSTCAVATNRIKLGTGIAVIFNRSPTTMAMCAASLDIISKGRLILGLGQGHRTIVEGENGLQFVKPTQRLIEYTEIVRGLIKDGRISYDGHLFKVNYNFWFKPYRPKVPIYFPPMFEKSAERTGRIADGALATWLTVPRARALVAIIRQGATDAGRAPDDVDIACYLPTVVTRDKEVARRHLRHHLAWYVGTFPRYRKLLLEDGFGEVQDAARVWQDGDQQVAADLLPAKLVDSAAIIGDVDECRARIQEYRAAGVTHPVVYPLPLIEAETKEAFLSAVRLTG
jgi:alkanesulfonate monooxygenase SsuD/methylene tetrahydromethanopterin reductase-like flavin-dependent oxidoreductase (luciferase family)